MGEGDTREQLVGRDLEDTEAERGAQGYQAPLQPHTRRQGPHDMGWTDVDSPSTGGREPSSS